MALGSSTQNSIDIGHDIRRHTDDIHLFYLDIFTLNGSVPADRLFGDHHFFDQLDLNRNFSLFIFDTVDEKMEKKRAHRRQRRSLHPGLPLGPFKSIPSRVDCSNISIIAG